MLVIARLASLWNNLTRRRLNERELDDEVQGTLELLVTEKIHAGLSTDEARRVAVIELGGVEQVKEQIRYAKVGALLDSVGQDIRYAARSLRNNPGFTATAILTIALGIGANTAIFSVVNALLLQPLPYKGSDRWVRIVGVDPSGAPPTLAGVNHLEQAALASQSRTLSHVGFYSPKLVLLSHREQVIRLEGLQLSPAVFSMLGERPILGRIFDTPETIAESAAVVVLSFPAWHKYFGGAADIIGQTVTIDREPYSIIGVMGATFQFPSSQAQFWIPFVPPTGDRARFQWFSPIARVKDGIPIDAAAAEVTDILKELRGNGVASTPPDAIPQAVSPGSPSWKGPFGLVRLRDDLVARVKPALLVLAGAVGFVLLIACANVANLLLARMGARQREFAIRHALGAGRGRLFRQVLLESLMLGLLGGVAGVGIASAGLMLFRTEGMTVPRRDVGMVPLEIPRADEIQLNASVLGFTLAVSLVTAVLFGLAPALRQARSRNTDGLRQAGGTVATAGFSVRRRFRLQGLLVVGEVAMAMMLLVGGALLINSVINLSQVDPGYDAENVLTFQVSVPWGRVVLGPSTPAERQRVTAFAEDLVARLRTIPGVTSAGYARQLPMFQVYMENLPLRRQPPTPGDPPPLPPKPGVKLPADFPDVRVVSQDFFKVMNTRIVAGRGFSDADVQGQPRVAVINQTLARSGILGTTPIGQLVYSIGPVPSEIVGIVEDVREIALDREPDPQIFFDFRQRPAAEGPYFVVRTDSPNAALTSSLHGVVRQIEPAATLDNVASMEQLVSISMQQRRLYAGLLGSFAGLAVGLAAIGIYGVLAYSVAQRTREIGIRMALGARKSLVMRHVLGQSLVLISVGVLVGLLGAAAVTRYLKGMLFGLTPLDPSTFLAVAVLFVLVATFAALVPARRATKVDPMVALRCE